MGGASLNRYEKENGDHQGTNIQYLFLGRPRQRRQRKNRNLLRQSNKYYLVFNSNMSTPLITEEGLAKLKSELDYLWRTERPEVTKKVTWAASLGDRSENADYQYNKKKLREIDRRVRYLRKRIDSLKVVPYAKEQEGTVYFGSWVKIENEEGETKELRIVGYDEIFGEKNYISVDSPMARALLRKKVGDEAVVKTEAGEFYWEIVEITYQK